MDELQKAWAAGLIDGEGCFTIRLNRASSKTRQATDQYALIIQVTMCDKPTVEVLQELFGVGHVLPHQGKEFRDGRRRAAWTWYAQSRNAGYAIREIQPYLVTKAGEAKIALRFLDLPKWVGGRSRTPPEMVAKRHQVYLELREAKGRTNVPMPPVGTFEDGRRAARA